MKRLQQLLLRTLTLLSLFIEDIAILVGVLVIVKATYLLSPIAGMYVTGFILCIFGLILSKKPPKIPKRR